MPEVSEERSIAQALDAAGVDYLYLYPSSSGGWQIETFGRRVDRLIERLTAAGFCNVKAEADHLDDKPMMLARFDVPPQPPSPLRGKSTAELQFARQLFAEADDYEAVQIVDAELELREKRQRLTSFITRQKSEYERGADHGR